MYWNHRLMQRVESPGEAWEETVLYVVEVYYNDEDGSIIGWTEKESVWGETVDEVRQTLDWMKDATEKPILIEADLLEQSEAIQAMGADVHEVGIPEFDALSNWEDDGGRQ